MSKISAVLLALSCVILSVIRLRRKFTLTGLISSGEIFGKLDKKDKVLLAISFGFFLSFIVSMYLNM